MVATPYAMLPGIVYLLSLRHCESFSFSESPRKPEAPTNTDGSTRKNLDRREWLSGVVFASGILTGAGNARADGIDVSSIQMKEFVDPQGLFSITVPNDFYTIRRQAKGDLPDAKGKGRRGSSIFTAGNMAKAEVIAVERLVVYSYLRTVIFLCNRQCELTNFPLQVSNSSSFGRKWDRGHWRIKNFS